MGIFCFIIICILVIWLGYKILNPSYDYPYDNNYNKSVYNKTQKIKTITFKRKDYIPPNNLPEVKPEINNLDLPIVKVENELPVSKI